MNNSDLADAIKRAVSMRDVCARYGLEITRGGYILCPFHDEKTPSLKLYKNGFKCFGCGAGGSVIDFVMHYLHLDFGAAVNRIGYDFGLNFPTARPLTYREKKHAAQAQKRQRERDRQRAEENRRAEESYDRVFAVWQQLDVFKRTLRPKSPDEPLNPFFVLALHHIDKYEQLLDEKEYERRCLLERAHPIHSERNRADSGVDEGAIPEHDRAV